MYILFAEKPNQLLNIKQKHLSLLRFRYHSAIVVVAVWLNDKTLPEKVPLPDHPITTKSPIIFKFHTPFCHDKESWKFHSIEF